MSRIARKEEKNKIGDKKMNWKKGKRKGKKSKIHGSSAIPVCAYVEPHVFPLAAKKKKEDNNNNKEELDTENGTGKKKEEICDSNKTKKKRAAHYNKKKKKRAT